MSILFNTIETWKTQPWVILDIFHVWILRAHQLGISKAYKYTVLYENLSILFVLTQKFCKNFPQQHHHNQWRKRLKKPSSCRSMRIIKNSCTNSNKCTSINNHKTSSTSLHWLFLFFQHVVVKCMNACTSLLYMSRSISKMKIFSRSYI